MSGARSVNGSVRWPLRAVGALVVLCVGSWVAPGVAHANSGRASGAQTAPAVAGVTPSTGFTDGGTKVTITGRNLEPVLSVRFGSKAGTVIDDSDTTIVVSTPPESAGLVSVTVTTSSGTAYDLDCYRYVQTPVPSIVYVSPSTGYTLGGTSVTIAGTNLAPALSVRFGAKSARVIQESGSKLVVATPPEAVGTVAVTVVTPGGTSVEPDAYQFIRVPAPTITSVTPASGVSTGGTKVTITGKDLARAQSVLFGSVSATVVSDLATKIVATTPPHGAGSVDVSVTTPGGTASRSNSFRYTRPPVPEIVKVSPSSGPLAGGTVVTITGSHLSSASQVLFGTRTATISSDSSTKIVVTTPHAGSGVVAVEVVTRSGATTKGSAFRYVGAPVVTSVSPSIGPIKGGTKITLAGTNLEGSSSVLIGSKDGSIVSDSATAIVVAAPPGVPGDDTVEVTTPGGQTLRANGYRYVAPPSITSVSPSNGLVSGGATVTITGQNLLYVDSVSFGARTAVIRSDGATKIVVTTPAASAGDVSVAVTTPGGVAAKTNGFRYVAPPETVTFVGNDPYPGGASGSMAPEVFTSGVPQALSATGFADEGFSFASWNTLADGDGLSYRYGQTITIASSFTLYAQWTPTTESVMFDANDAYAGGAAGSMLAQTFTSGVAQDLTLNSFSDQGYTFAGWNTAPDGSGTAFSDGQSITLYAATTLYAQWTPTTESVMFDANAPNMGGLSGTMSPQTFTSGVAQDLTPDVFSDTGYAFAGWTTSPDGSGTAFSDGQSITLYAPLTLYAQWTALTESVTFDANAPNPGGLSGTMNPQSFTSGVEQDLTLSAFSDQGYTFVGWNTAPDGSGTTFTDGQSITLDVATTLYAQWTALTESVTFDANAPNPDGLSGTMDPQSFTSGVAQALTPNAFSDQGYTFAGWNTAPDGSGVSFSDGQSITLDAPLTLYAQWTALTESVTFDANAPNPDGLSGTMSPQSFTSGAAQDLTPNAFSDQGYTFAGWNTAPDGSGVSFSDGQSITLYVATTLYAQWTADPV